MEVSGASTRVQLGSEPDGCLQAFIRSAYPEIYSYLFRRCGGHRHVAEDLTQETFVSAIESVRAGKVDALSVPWLIGVARHKFADHYRRLERDQRKLRRVWARRSADREADVDIPVPDAVTACLAQLPAGERAALVLHHVDGLPLDEVARLMHRSVAATNALVARARHRFEQLYQETGDD